MAIVNPQFVKFYNYVFKFIGEKTNRSITAFWENISDIMLADLDKTIKIRGLRGAYDYWKYILKEECAKAKLNYYPDNRLELIMDDCPSCKILGDDKWKGYCNHCRYMYAPIFKKYGYNYKLEIKGNGKCRILIQKEKL